MTNAQQSKYHINRQQWEAARAKRGLPCDKCALDALKLRRIGSAKSSTRMTNEDFDEMLRAFLGISQPDNLDAQLDLEESPDRRRQIILERCARACEAMHAVENDERTANGGAAYIAGTAVNMYGEPTEQLKEWQLRRVMGVLEKHAARLQQRAVSAAAGAVLEEKEPF
jgi:hypothetical protein